MSFSKLCVLLLKFTCSQAVVSSQTGLAAAVLGGAGQLSFHAPDPEAQRVGGNLFSLSVAPS